ncbi:hypothetical protein [Asanoa iriomotensis]|nr:hypothetical protein [Asanoa iriomotensis]
MRRRFLVIDADGAARSDHQPDQPLQFAMNRISEAEFEAGCAGPA